MTTTAQSTAEQNKELIRGLYDAVRNADLEAFFAGCSPDMVLYEAESMVVGGTYRGREEITGCLGQLVAAYDMTTIDLKRMVADDDYVVAMASFMTSGADPQEVKITEWWQIKDGKVIEVRPFYWDTEELNKVLAG